MKAIIPISLKRIAIQQMQNVQSGKLSRLDAEQSIKRICKLSKSDITAHLTREYDQQTVEAFQYFRLL
jgi:hypothetical protein